MTNHLYAQQYEEEDSQISSEDDQDTDEAEQVEEVEIIKSEPKKKRKKRITRRPKVKYWNQMHHGYFLSPGESRFELSKNSESFDNNYTDFYSFNSSLINYYGTLQYITISRDYMVMDYAVGLSRTLNLGISLKYYNSYSMNVSCVGGGALCSAYNEEITKYEEPVFRIKKNFKDTPTGRSFFYASYSPDLGKQTVKELSADRYERNGYRGGSQLGLGLLFTKITDTWEFILQFETLMNSKQTKEVDVNSNLVESASNINSLSVGITKYFTKSFSFNFGLSSINLEKIKVVTNNNDYSHDVSSRSDKQVKLSLTYAMSDDFQINYKLTSNEYDFVIETYSLYKISTYHNYSKVSSLGITMYF